MSISDHRDEHFLSFSSIATPRKLEMRFLWWEREKKKTVRMERLRSWCRLMTCEGEGQVMAASGVGEG
jgi:hypothetical protein